MKKGYILTCAVLAFFVACGTQTETIEIETHTVQRSEFISSLTETGELAAVRSTMIQSPSISWRFGQLTISSIVEDGTEVDSGEVLCEFDPGEIERSIVEAKSELEIAESELRRTQAQQQSQIRDLEAELEKSKLQHRKSELQLQQAEFESDVRRKELELQLEQSSINLEKAEQEIENQKLINQEELNKLRLEVKQTQSQLDDAYNTLKKMTLIAPSPGIAIIEENWSTDNKFAVNDQAWPGHELISLPDMSQMKAEVEVNEVDIAKIDTMQQVYVRMDAYSDTVFTGYVHEVARLARNKDRDSNVKVFDIVVFINGSSDKLMPGSTVSCEIILDRIPDVLSIPLEALFIKNGNDIVYVKHGNHFEAQKVATGLENENFVQIVSGLEEKDEVALMDPTLGQEEETEGDES